MKMRLGVIFVLFLNPLNIKCQNYIPYFKAMAQAETAVSDSNFNDALEIYQNQFYNYTFIFPKDAYIAAQVAIAIKNESLAKYFIYRGISCGIDSGTLTANPHTYRWWMQNRGTYMTVTIYDSLRKINEARINQSLRKQMVELITQDQKLRNRNERYLNAVVFNHKLKPRLFRKWMRQADSQSVQILKLTRQYGFPSHQLIGTNDRNIYRRFGTNMRSTYATVILFHANHAWQYFEKDLPAQLEKGYVTPKQYALLRDFATRHTITGNLKDTGFPDYQYFVRWKSNVMEPDSAYKVQRAIFIKQNMETIDSARASIFLPSYKTGIKIVEMQNAFYEKYWGPKNADCLLFDFCYFEWD